MGGDKRKRWPRRQGAGAVIKGRYSLPLAEWDSRALGYLFHQIPKDHPKNEWRGIFQPSAFKVIVHHFFGSGSV